MDVIEQQQSLYDSLIELEYKIDMLANKATPRDIPELLKMQSDFVSGWEQYSTEQKRVLSALASMPEEKTVYIIKSWLQYKSTAQIGGDLNCSQSTAARRLREAKATLNASLYN